MIDVREQLVQDEGQCLKVYLDAECNLTVGIGHRVLPSDNLKLGDTIDYIRCYELFNRDLEIAVAGVQNLIPAGVFVPADIHAVLVNMAFNLGQTKLAGFTHMLMAVKVQDWKHMAMEMIDSRWFDQVKSRAGRLVNVVLEQAVA
jgi:lysozyme